MKVLGDCGPPGSSVHGVLQARILEWVAVPSSRASSGPKDGTGSLMSPALAAGIVTIITAWEAHSFLSVTIKKQPCWGLGFQHVNSASIINTRGQDTPVPRGRSTRRGSCSGTAGGNPPRSKRSVPPGCVVIRPKPCSDRTCGEKGAIRTRCRGSWEGGGAGSDGRGGVVRKGRGRWEGQTRGRRPEPVSRGAWGLRSAISWLGYPEQASPSLGLGGLGFQI